MSLQNTAASYDIKINLVGTGAVVAKQELEQLSGTMERTAVAASHANSSLHQLEAGSKAAKASFHEFHSVSLLVGGHLPELSNGLMAVQGGMHATASLAKTAGANIGIAAAAVAGLVAILHAGASAWEAYKAKQEAAESFSRAAESQEIQRAVLEKHIESLQQLGKLSEDEARYLKQSIAENERMVATRLRAVEGTNAEIKAAQQLKAMRDDLFERTLSGYEKERYAAGHTYDETIAKIRELAKAAGNQMPAAVTKGFEDLAMAGYQANLKLLQEKRDQEAAEKALQEAKRQTAELDKSATEGMEELERQLTISSLTGSKDRVQQAREEYQTRVEYYQELYEAGAISEEKLAQKTEEATIKRLESEKKADDQIKIHVMTTNEMIAQAADYFATDFSQAVTDFVSGTKTAKEAFREFAADFTKQVAQMILKEEMLLLIKTALRAFGLPVAAEGGTFSRSTSSQTPTFAAAGVAGVSSVSSPTYFPNFNVVAGEAGGEMMTVLARPRFMEVGGIEAVVGSARGNTLAITKASDLARGGHGGEIHIRISHSEDAKAEIINSSIQGARLTVIKEAQQSGPLRRALKTVTK